MILEPGVCLKKKKKRKPHPQRQLCNLSRELKEAVLRRLGEPSELMVLGEYPETD